MAPNPIDFNKVFNANLAENPVALATYDVLSTIVELMDQRGFTALQKVRLTRDNVRPIFRKDISGKVRNKRALIMLFFGTRKSAPYLIIPVSGLSREFSPQFISSLWQSVNLPFKT